MVKESVANSGSFAIRLQNVAGTKTVGSNAPVNKDTVSAIAMLGESFDKPGLPFSQRPVALNGYYKFNQGALNSATDVDTALIMVF